MYLRFFKPTLDIFSGFVLSVFTFPIIVVLFFLVKLSSEGPFIFKQTRVGKNSLPFTIYKIRTMTHTPGNTGSFSTSANDKRITRVGKILRKTSLDELPQFWNLLFGSMSLIGPRPDVPAQQTNYTDEQWKQRHLIKPGITGLAQCLFRSSATPSQRVRLDLFYVKKCSLALDFIIVLKTLGILVKKGVQN